ncbi:MAG: tetratricopeptide repeat protein [Nostocaceae cyanobacterium]|nr:tetratricopeptide repeat protein [Nostocaceae cyanobacterium]
MTTVADALKLAVQYHQAKRLPQAEQVYRQILDVSPQQPEALYGLGVLAQQKGQHKNAEQLLKTALELQPQSLKVWFSLGNLHQVQGKLQDAEDCYRQALQLQPQSVSVYNNLGYTLQQQNKWEEAIACYEKVLALQPDCQEAKVNLGNVLDVQGKLSPQQKSYYAALNNQLGINRKNAGDLKTAIAYYQQAIELQPDFASAHYNLGNALQMGGDLNGAYRSYLRAIEFKPDYAYAYNNLGNIFQQQGKQDEAIEYYREAIKIQPNYGHAYNNLGNLLQQKGELEKALESYFQAIKFAPDYAQAHYNLGHIYRKQNKLDEAIKFYQNALEIQPEYADAKFGVLMSQLPIIYSSFNEIKFQRHQYQQHLEELANSYKLASPREQAKAADAVGSLQPYFLAYQGLNDRELQRIYGEMICEVMSSRYPQWSQSLEIPNLKAGEKIRIGFISGYFNRHSVWKIPIKGWIEQLDRNKFELFGYYTNSKKDTETSVAAQLFSKFIQAPLSIAQWCQVISQDKLHVVIFPEIGMEPMTVKLGCLRLAPVQIAFGGHPETTGLPTIDYHLSSELMEPENAQECYTEKLVKLPNLAVHYTPFTIPPETVSKQDIGIGADEIMFWCCQSSSKYLPQHDDLFPRIAQNLGNCKFVFIQNSSEHVSECFRQRLRSIFANFELNYQKYCIFLPRLNASQFAGVTAIADIFLDTIGWSGNNTTMESTAYNLPIVTFPGDLMRGRHAMAILKMMGVEETIADSKDDYVKIAVRLAKDSDYRQYISEKIARNKYKIYGDLAPIKALESFLLNLVQHK